MLLAEELQGEPAGGDLVAVVDDRDRIGGCGDGHTLRSEDLRVGVHLEDAVELLGSPVVGVLVGDDDGHDVTEIGERHRECTGVDDQRFVGFFEDEGGVFVLGQLHGASLRRALHCPVF